MQKCQSKELVFEVKKEKSFTKILFCANVRSLLINLNMSQMKRKEGRDATKIELSCSISVRFYVTQISICSYFNKYIPTDIFLYNIFAFVFERIDQKYPANTSTLFAYVSMLQDHNNALQQLCIHCYMPCQHSVAIRRRRN